MMISDDMELETPTIVAEAKTIDDDITMKAFEELAKSLNITEVSELYPLITMSNYTKIMNHMSISNMVCEIFMSICKTNKGIDKLVDNNYLDVFLLLKRVLINTGTLAYLNQLSSNAACLTMFIILRRKSVIPTGGPIVAIF